MAPRSPIWPAFSRIGIELEYMLVDQHRLEVRPIAEEVLRGLPVQDKVRSDQNAVTFSNEFVKHVIEIKNTEPSEDLVCLGDAFRTAVAELRCRAQNEGARLMPTAMHPWMNPMHEAIIWDGENADLYQVYASIFQTWTHGWVNLQSMHINLPFIDENEFVRLHAVVRWVLPILPALAASSPIADGYATNFADYRLDAYRNNADGFPMIVGQVIPEAIFSYAEYQQKILEPMYREIRPHDPTGLLEQEWLNSRGAIARFDRQSIEIRLLDTQECVAADLAVAAAVIHMIRNLYESPITNRDFLSLSTERLASILDRCIRMAEFAEIDDEDYLRLWSIDAPRVPAGDVWRHALASAIEPDGALAEWRGPLEQIWQHGTLARRIINRIGNDFSREHLREVYRELCDCLDCDRLFQGDRLTASVGEAVMSADKGK